MKRTFLAGLLALCLLAALPAGAFAENIPADEQAINGSEGNACAVTAGCELPGGHEDDCVLASAGTEPEATESLPDSSVPDIENGVPTQKAPLAESNVIQANTAKELIAAVKAASPDTSTTIQITADLTLNEEVATNKAIVLTSDGPHTITFSSMQENKCGFNLYNGGTLTIGLPGDSGSALTICVKASANIRALVNCSGGNLILNHGELRSDGVSMNKGVVCLTNKSTITMNGGKIDGGSTARNVWLESSTFTMNDGEIISGKAGNQGGGVYLTGSQPHFVMNGGSIAQCEAPYNGGGVALWSDAVFEMKDGAIANCTSNVGGGVYIRKDSNASFTMEGGEVRECTAKYGGGGIYMEDGTRFTMSGGTISNCGRVSGGTTICNGGGVYIKGANAVFAMNGGTISRCEAPGNSGGGIYTQDATVTVKGTIRECEARNGGGVCCFGKARLTIGEHGAIADCKAEIHGGGIFVEGSETELIMDGGVITSCTALQGGGIFFRTGKAFTLKAGTISGCTATGDMAKGGGVFLRDIGEFTMSGGAVLNNTAPYMGGGIYIGAEGNPPAGSYQITAGVISGNGVTDPYGFGGGIYVPKEVTLQLENALITKNTATALGGGIWACRTGAIKVYVTDGGAVYDNDAQAKDTNEKTPDQAGDDIAFVASVAVPATMTLYARMLGGELNHYYMDGGITWLNPGDDHTAGLGLGAPDGQTLRYDAGDRTPCVDTENLTGFTALKNVVPDDAKAAARTAAKLIITGNFASRGGGIGTNGNLIIGTPHDETYSVTVEKDWAADTPAGRETPVSVYLKIGEEKLGPVTLNEENGWTASFTGLTDKPDEVKYAATEEPVPEGFTPSYSEAVFNGTAGTIVVTNTDSPEPPAPEKGNLTVSKTVSGDGADYTKGFQFTVALTDATIEGTYGEMTFTDGKAVFTLKDDESKTARDLPAGIGYTVTESDNDGYTVTKTGDVGSIPAGHTAEARFNNHRGSGNIPDIPPIDPIWPDVPDNPVIPDSPEPPHTGEPCHPAWLLLLAAGALLAVLGLAGRNRHPGKHES